MECLKFALELEKSIQQQIQTLHVNTSEELQTLLNVLLDFETHFCRILSQAQKAQNNVGAYPEIELNQLVGSDKVWKKIEESIPAQPVIPHDLTTIWAIYNMLEKSAQFYQQSMHNSPYPTTRLFMSSLFEVKKIIKKRIDVILRRMYNQVWEQVGFAPFLLGKD